MYFKKVIISKKKAAKTQKIRNSCQKNATRKVNLQLNKSDTRSKLLKGNIQKRNTCICSIYISDKHFTDQT